MPVAYLDKENIKGSHHDARGRQKLQFPQQWADGPSWHPSPCKKAKQNAEMDADKFVLKQAKIP